MRGHPEFYRRILSVRRKVQPMHGIRAKRQHDRQPIIKLNNQHKIIVKFAIILPGNLQHLLQQPRPLRSIRIQGLLEFLVDCRLHPSVPLNLGNSIHCKGKKYFEKKNFYCWKISISLFFSYLIEKFSNSTPNKMYFIVNFFLIFKAQALITNNCLFMPWLVGH